MSRYLKSYASEICKVSSKMQDMQLRLLKLLYKSYFRWAGSGCTKGLPHKCKLSNLLRWWL